MGDRTVDCVTSRPASSRFKAVAVPLLDPMESVIYRLNRGPETDNEPADAITALVLLTWALWHSRHRGADELHLLTVHNKAISIVSGSRAQQLCLSHVDFSCICH